MKIPLKDLNITTPIGKGSNGVVVKVEQPSGDNYALKIQEFG
jgi:serine/threonine protein kinase